MEEACKNSQNELCNTCFWNIPNRNCDCAQNEACTDCLIPYLVEHIKDGETKLSSCCVCDSLFNIIVLNICVDCKLFVCWSCSSNFWFAQNIVKCELCDIKLTDNF